MNERKVITEEVEKNLVDTVLQFVIKEGLTVTNIKEAMNKVYGYFEGNATLEKTAQEMNIQEQSNVIISPITVKLTPQQYEELKKNLLSDLRILQNYQK